MKRFFDLILGVLLSGPALMVVVAILPIIWLETRANPLFRQNRVGRDGRVFVMVKLRTMRADTPNLASHEIGSDAITGLGRLLRRTKIDELPQLWNVLRGEMSMVGPRPCLPNQLELIAERARRGVMALRPGITGIGQLAGLDMSEPIALADADAIYLSRWTLQRDLGLLCQTVTGRGRGDAAVTKK